MSFDTIMVVDWSARSVPSPKAPTKDSIWAACATNESVTISYHQTRSDLILHLTAFLDAELQAGRRTLIGFDFPFGYPKGFSQVVCGSRNPLSLWRELAARIEDDDDNANNRFDVATEINRLFPGVGPFWGCPAKYENKDLPARGRERTNHGLPERRWVETQITSAQPCWKLYTTGSVGSQVLLGLPRLDALRQQFGPRIAVSPFESPNAQIVLGEIYPSMLSKLVKSAQRPGEILDRAQVRVLAQAFKGLPATLLEEMLREGDPEEGWILGLGHEAALRSAYGDHSAE